ncbi:MAG: L-serine ammonia-lyase, iron-sulfur-dependent, subunit alpha [Candidatus Hodarchaeales archaeon]|jgi:L-cysteine desulfidase
MISKKQQIINLQSENMNNILTESIQPYLGCTDITIIALGTALAASTAKGIVPKWVDSSVESNLPKKISIIEPENILSISLKMNIGLYKNSHATAIPTANGHSGIHKSAALGIFSDPENKLNLFTDITSDDIEKMKQIVTDKKITVETVNVPACNLFLHSTITVQTDHGIIKAESCLQNSYTNVVFLRRNGLDLVNKTAKPIQIRDQLVEFDVSSFIKALDNLTPEVYEKLSETITLNTQAYQYGLKHAPGLGIGERFNRLIQKNILGKDVANLAASKTAAAEDVRMGGVDLPVMGIASSGSHGIASSIPVIAVAKEFQKDKIILLKSIALSFWITQKINGYIGYLSAPCGCVIKSGIGATAGIAYYMGGTISQIEQGINNYIISTAGVICDGGKTTCSLKLANGASTAVQSAFLALEGVNLSNDTGGIVREELQKNIENIVLISHSMQNIDEVIINILQSY